MTIDREQVQRWLDAYSRAWVSDEAIDPVGTYEGRYEPVAVDGRCRSLTEWYIENPRPGGSEGPTP